MLGKLIWTIFTNHIVFMLLLSIRYDVLRTCVVIIDLFSDNSMSLYKEHDFRVLTRSLTNFYKVYDLFTAQSHDNILLFILTTDVWCTQNNVWFRFWSFCFYIEYFLLNNFNVYKIIVVWRLVFHCRCRKNAKKNYNSYLKFSKIFDNAD